jgi:hypothetical protein
MKSATNVTRMRREWAAQRGALANVRLFNATLSAKGYVWFRPKIAAALTLKYHWLIIGCDSCGTEPLGTNKSGYRYQFVVRRNVRFVRQ